MHCSCYTHGNLLAQALEEVDARISKVEAKETSKNAELVIFIN